MVYKSREDGGLGVKNLEWFNMAMLAKWRWRILGMGQNVRVRPLWTEILVILRVWHSGRHCVG